MRRGCAEMLHRIALQEDRWIRGVLKRGVSGTDMQMQVQAWRCLTPCATSAPM